MTVRPIRSSLGWIHSNSLTIPTNGIMISGLTTIPRLAQSAAASNMARTCISTISGIEMLKRTPRSPIMGLDSCMPLIAWSSCSLAGKPSVTPVAHCDYFFKNFFFSRHLHASIICNTGDLSPILPSAQARMDMPMAIAIPMLLESRPTLNVYFIHLLLSFILFPYPQRPLISINRH